MWAPYWSSFTRPHWYFGAHIFNKMLKVVTKNKNYLHVIPWINFHIILMRTTSFDVGPMKSPTIENVSSVANSIPDNPHNLRGRLQIFWPVSRMRKFSRPWDENLPHDQIMDRFTAITPCFSCKYFEDFDLTQKCAKQDRMYWGEKIKIKETIILIFEPFIIYQYNARCESL